MKIMSSDVMVHRYSIALNQVFLQSVSNYIAKFQLPTTSTMTWLLVQNWF